MSDCKHPRIQTFRFEDGTPAGLWGCAECSRKFAPTDAAPAQRADEPVAKRTTGFVAPRDRYVPPVLFNPYTGEPRDVRDVQSDPQGILIVPPGAAMLAAAPAAPAYVMLDEGKVCHGIPRVGCNYLAECDSVCNKCGNVHDVMHLKFAAPVYVPLTDDGIAKCLADAGLHADDYKEDGQIEPLVRAIESLVVARMRGEK